MDAHQAASAFADLPVLALLDSTGPVGQQARYSYLCVDPFRVVSVRDEVLFVDGVARVGDALALVAAMATGTGVAHDPAGPPFQGGAVGYIGYDFAARLEGVAAPAGCADDPAELFIGFYDLVMAFDRQTRRLCLYASGLPEQGRRARSQRAAARLDWAANRLARASGRAPKAPLPLAWRPGRTRAQYVAQVRRVLAYIAAGDIFQANISSRFTADRPTGLQPWDLQATLRMRNPAPFGAWLRCGAHDLCCSSPERFLSLDAQARVQARPIKGTIARQADPAADTAAAAALTTSVKDRAENLMIVDVLRNDIGRVSEIGSVAVPALCALESYATVHHLVSVVAARLRAPAGAADLLGAALPGGSITGAPKRRAMQIIAQLEQQRRGMYCGNVLWLGFDGAMDSNIVIRSLVLTPRQIIAQAGGGIVADSDPKAEYEEMMLKLHSVVAGVQPR